MGLFGKKPSQEDKDRAASVFADRDKGPVNTGGDGVEDRILGYNTLKGAETLKPAQKDPAAPVDRIAELRRIRAEGKDAATQYKQVVDAKADAEARSAADEYMTARKNILDSAGIARGEQLSAEERAEIERQGMGTLGNITDGIKNKQFLTEVDAEIGEILAEKKAATKALRPEDINLSEKEVDAATAKFRNVGFFTETEVDESKKVLTGSEKLEQDLEELDHAEQAIKSFTNIGFRNQSLEQVVGEEIKEEEEGG